jgi:hypothetical protein
VCQPLLLTLSSWAQALLNCIREALSSNPFRNIDGSDIFHDFPQSVQENAKYTRIYNKVRELIPVKVLHASLLIMNVIAFKVRPLGSYATMPVPSPHFKTILELVLWNGL